jgi:tryptophan-rich sensory protein
VPCSDYNSQQYDTLGQISVYRHHIATLRPWDRPLPDAYLQQLSLRDAWNLDPPSLLQMLGVLCSLLVLLEAIGLLPLWWNEETLSEIWKVMKKPGALYDNGSVLVAVWALVHMTTAMCVWLVYLGGGFQKYKMRLFPLFCAIFVECSWSDAVFHKGRLDVGLAIWIMEFIFLCIAQVTIVRVVKAAGLFLLPMMAVLGYLIYLFSEFIHNDGIYLRRQGG